MKDSHLLTQLANRHFLSFRRQMRNHFVQTHGQFRIRFFGLCNGTARQMVQATRRNGDMDTWFLHSIGRLNASNDPPLTNACQAEGLLFQMMMIRTRATTAS